MARIRSLKPEYFADEDLAVATSRDARLLYPGLWGLADEWGRLRGNPAFVKGHVFPYDDDLDAAAVDRLIDELAAAGKVVRYRVGHATYLFLPNLKTHQRLEPEKTASRLPPPDQGTPDPFPPATTVPADDSENFPGKPAEDPEESALACARLFSKEQVAGSRVHGGNSPSTTVLALVPPMQPTFEDFWAVYPLKKSKADAIKAWPKAIKKASPESIIAAAISFRDDPTRDPRYTAHAPKWLNGERWNDERGADGRRIVAPKGMTEYGGQVFTDKTVASLSVVEQYAAAEAAGAAARESPSTRAIEGATA